MTPLFPAQRAAEEFDQALGGTATQAVVDRYAELLDTVVVLREQPEVMPRAEFVGDLRSRLMTAAETELAPATPSVVRHLAPARTRRNRRLGTVAATLVIVGGSAGMAAAASGSLPGESLYPIKIGVERASTAARLSDVSQGEALLNQAATRLDEVRALQAQSDPDPLLVADTVDAFRSAADAGSEKLFTAYRTDGDAKNITTVRTFTAQQMADVAALSSVAKGGTADVLLDAADTLADIDQQARVLCGACGPGSTLSLPGPLSAGAGAATVDNLLSRPVSQAQVDIDETEAARVERLKAIAEKEAGKIPRIPTTGIGSGAGIPSVSTPDGPVTATITRDGQLVPSITSGVAVKDLVSGVTGNVDDLTTKVTDSKALPLDTTAPLDKTVDDLTDTVDKTVDDLLPDP
jgi:hypothetical protein